MVNGIVAVHEEFHCVLQEGFGSGNAHIVQSTHGLVDPRLMKRLQSDESLNIEPEQSS